MTGSQYSIARFLNIRAANFPGFIADGKRIIFLTDTTGTPQVWQAALPSKPGDILWPDQLTFDADRVMGVWPSPVDTRLIYSADVGGNENAQLFLLDIDSGREIALTTGYDSVMHGFGEWSPDGRQIMYAANRRHPGLFDVYVQPLDGEARLVWQNDRPGFIFNMTFSPDGQRAAISLMSSSFSSTLYEIDLKTGRARRLTSETEPARYDNIHYAADGRSLFLLTDLNADFMRLARLNLDTLALETLTADEWDIEIAALSPDGRSLVYELNVDGASQLYLYDVTSGTTRPAPAIGSVPGVVGPLDLRVVFSPDSSKAAFAFTSATRSSDIFIWDLMSNQIYPVTRVSHAGIAPESFAAPELIHYPTFDHDAAGKPRQIPAWFFRPKQSDTPAPVIIVIHGGPEGQSRPLFTFYIQYFLQSGYAVFVPNVRGSTGYGKTYGHLDDVRKRMDSVADIAYAAEWLKAQPGVDGSRLVVYGGSYGGFMVLSSLTTYPHLWAAGVDIVGISNFVTFLENTSEYRRAHREVEYGSLREDREFLHSISPLTHIQEITVPLMVIHGANDPRVPLGETQQLVKALQEREVPVEFLVFDDEGHGIIKLKNKLVAYPSIVRFLQQHVPV